MLELIPSIFSTIGSALVWTMLIYFIYTVSYSFILSVAAFFYHLPVKKTKDSIASIVVLIPAYKEDGVIIGSAEHALSHDYPNDKYDVVVIADSLQDETLNELDKLAGLIVIKVDFETSTKVKALNAALKELDSTYEIGVILDADNQMEKGFLKKISSCFLNGYSAIQGQRVAKNKDTSMSLLDGLSESINNHIYRQGTTALGLSCSFIGSGMAIDFKLMKETLMQMDSVGGFDRDMEVRLIGKGYRVHYLKSAVILDEKVENTKVFANQRKRWIYSQYHYLYSELKPGIKRLLRGDFVYFNSAVLRNIQLPRLINLGILLIVFILSLLLPKYFSFSSIVWGLLLLLLVLSNVIAIPKSYYNRELLKAIISLPRVFIIMFLLLFKLRGSNKSFIHTPHSK